MNHSNGPIVLAFSGGLDTTAIALWLAENYSSEIIAYCAALGNADSPESIGRRANELGIKTYIYEDLEEEFLSDYITPFLKSGASYQSTYLLGTALARPLISKKIAEVAKKHHASAIVHGATGKGNDQIRFEKAWSFLLPNLEVIAPWKIWDFKGRDDLIQYIKEKGYEFEFPNKTFSIDENLFHISYEGGPLENLQNNYEECLPALVPSKTMSEKWTLYFESGALVGLAGGSGELSVYTPKAAFQKLNSLGFEFGIGIEDIVEERINGVKSRGVYHTPGGTLVKYALDQLKTLCWDYDMIQIATNLATKYGEHVYHGNWFSPAKKALDSFFLTACKNLTGEITLQLKPGAFTVQSRSATTSLYSEDLVSFEKDDFGLNEAAVGFCKTLNFKHMNLGVANV